MFFDVRLQAFVSSNNCFPMKYFLCGSSLNRVGKGLNS